MYECFELVYSTSMTSSDMENNWDYFLCFRMFSAQILLFRSVFSFCPFAIGKIQFSGKGLRIPPTAKDGPTMSIATLQEVNGTVPEIQ